MFLLACDSIGNSGSSSPICYNHHFFLVQIIIVIVIFLVILLFRLRYKYFKMTCLCIGMIIWRLGLYSVDAWSPAPPMNQHFDH